MARIRRQAGTEVDAAILEGDSGNGHGSDEALANGRSKETNGVGGLNGDTSMTHQEHI